MAPFAPGPLVRLARGKLAVDLAPQAGGRIAQIRHDGIDQLIGPEDGWPAMIAWGCYPMVPWAGRIRRGRFMRDGVEHQLPINMEPHAIHGVGFALPWALDAHTPESAELSLVLPSDARWPFGGIARQSIRIEDDRLHLVLSVQAGAGGMPAVVGWHPWFRKPDRLDFSPTHIYPRDAEGLATVPLVPPTPGPWDDCFLQQGDIVLHRGDRRLQLASDCTHWVVFDEMEHTTCVEPQSGPPDAFNLSDQELAPGETLEHRFTMAWG